MQRSTPALVIVWLLFAASPASGVDGVLEINQTCAVNSGCFPGDSAGFPVTITTEGVSVRLTSSLAVPDENTTAIQVFGADVTVDLNGFAISGPTVCSGSPLTCAPTGTGIGVSGGRTTVLNGSVRGMGDSGVSLTGSGAHVSGVRAVSNGSRGIWAGEYAVVTNCVARENGSTGIQGGDGLFSENNASYNGTSGIASGRGTVLGNTMNDNGGVGLNAGVTSTAYGHNQIYNNNGGNANPQVTGGLEIAPNVCGGDLVCP